jgi:hypothetical protein
MTKRQIENNLDAVRALRSYYRLKSERFGSDVYDKKNNYFHETFLGGCPLCSASAYWRKEYEEYCPNCLWVLFEGMQCFHEPHFEKTSLRSRIERLNRWEKKLIELRGEKA